MITKLALIGVVILLNTSCDKLPINSSDNELIIYPTGKQVSEERSVGEFNRVSMSGSSDVYISAGKVFKVEVKGSQNLVSNFITKVENNELILKYKEGVTVNSDDIRVYITMPIVNGVSTLGSGPIEISGNFASQEIFSSNISGSGKVVFDGILKVNNLESKISGSGNCDLQEITAKNANVEIQGSGNITTTVTDKLDVTTSGSGNTYYYGEPVVTSKVSGSGKVIKK